MLSGLQGSGKTTTATYLTHALWASGRKAQRLKFADILYEMHNAIRGILRRCGADELKTIDGPLLQLLGTEWGRKTRGEDIWVRCLLAAATDYWQQQPDGAVIIDDCSFENEHRAFMAMPEVAVTHVRLVADRATRKARAEKWRENETHASETGLDGLDDSYFDIVADTSRDSTGDIVERILDESFRPKADRPQVTA